MFIFKTQTKNSIFFVLCLILVYFLVTILSLKFQDVIDYNKYPMADALKYLSSLHFFENNETVYQAHFPFNTRIATQILVSKYNFLCNNTMQAYQILNIICGFLILVIIKVNYKTNSLSLFLILCYFIIHWSGLVRQYILDPIGVDLPYLLILTIFVSCLHNQKYKFLWIVVAISIPIKEAILPIIAAILVYELIKKLIFKQNTNSQYLIYISASVLIGIVVKLWIDLTFPPLNKSWMSNSVVQVMRCCWLAIKQPMTVIHWQMSIILVFGPFIILWIKNLVDTGYKNFTSIQIGSITALVLGIIGGGDHTRLVFLAFPLMLPSILIELEKYKISKIIIIFLFALIFTRFWQPIPSPTINLEDYKNWYPEY